MSKWKHLHCLIEPSGLITIIYQTAQQFFIIDSTYVLLTDKELVNIDLILTGKRQVRALHDTCYQCPFIIRISGSWWIRYGCKKYRCVTICYYRRFWCYWRLVCVNGQCKIISRCTYLRKSTQKRSRC